MNITERIFDTMESKKIKQNTLATHIDTTPQVINKWKTRGTTPPMEYLPKLSEALDVSWEWLVTGQENPNYLTKDEQALIKHYREMNPNGQKRLLETANELSRIYIGRRTIKRKKEASTSPKIQNAIFINNGKITQIKNK